MNKLRFAPRLFCYICIVLALGSFIYGMLNIHETFNVYTMLTISIRFILLVLTVLSIFLVLKMKKGGLYLFAGIEISRFIALIALTKNIPVDSLPIVWFILYLLLKMGRENSSWNRMQ